VSISKLLFQLKDVENKASELYKFIYKKITHRYPELASLVQILADEEKVHEKEVDLVLGVLRESPKSFVENPDALKRSMNILAKLEQNRIFLNQKIDFLDSEKIVNLIWEFEINLEETHHSFYYQVTDEKLKKLFNYLTNADRSHIEKIKKLSQL
jgi:rubrerythrin